MKTSLNLPPLPPLRRAAHLWVAYSGGLDSTALLHLLAAQKLPRLTALHVHHGLQADADQWAQRCRAQCRALKIPCKVLRVEIDPRHPAGPEAAAREARYAALAAQMKPGDLLITAHHQDDQAETVLLRLLRGTGISGLAAMQPLKPLAPGQLWRPLLNTARSELHAYALHKKLDWIEDPHNHQPRYARSFLRAEIFPRLKKQWPQAVESLARAAQHAAQAQQLLENLAAEDLRTVGWAEQSEAHGAGNRWATLRSAHPTLSVAGLLKLSASRRANVLRYWLAQRNFQAPSSAMLDRLDQEVLRARADAQPLLHGESYEFRRYRDSLYVMAPLAPAPQDACAWDGKDTLVLPAGCGELRGNVRTPQELTVSFARRGEKLKPQGDTHTRTLKYLFQQAAVPPWQRVRMPLIYRGDELLSVADRWLATDWAEELRTKRWRIQWMPFSDQT